MNSNSTPKKNGVKPKGHGRLFLELKEQAHSHKEKKSERTSPNRALFQTGEEEIRVNKSEFGAPSDTEVETRAKQ
ncbi:Uncharacterised protein [Cytobacillus firmus]|nr:Uncharacterised protein [Cytobacillus firmus]